MSFDSLDWRMTIWLPKGSFQPFILESLIKPLKLEFISMLEICARSGRGGKRGKISLQSENRDLHTGCLERHFYVTTDTAAGINKKYKKKQTRKEKE